MRHFGSTLTQSEIIDAVTCQADTAAHVSNYFNMLPTEKSVGTFTVKRVYYDTLNNTWAFATVTPATIVGKSTIQRIKPPTGYEKNGYAITNHFSNIYSYSKGPVAKNLIYNPVSFWVYNSITKKRVHPDLVPFYNGDTNDWTVKGLMDADIARAMSMRDEMIKTYAVDLAQTGLNAYSNALGVSVGPASEADKAQATNAAANATDPNKNDTYSDSQTNGNGASSNIVTKLLTTLVFAGLGFGVASYIEGRSNVE